MFHLLLSGLSCLVLFGQSPGPTGTPASQPDSVEPALSIEQLQQLALELDSPSYRTRAAASLRLMDAGPAAYGPLRDAFVRTRLYDSQRRIKQIALDIYLTEHVGPPRAFLGISHLGAPARNTNDARIPADATGLVITDVFSNTAADNAGIRPTDIILAFDGRRGTPDYPASRFTESIAQRRPGATCQLGVFRGGEGRILIEGEIPYFKPAEFALAKVQILRPGDDPRISEGAAALLLKDVSRLDSRLRLKEGDLIIALDDEPLKPDKAISQFEAWATLHANPWSPPAPAAPRGAEPRRGPASAQILRGGEWLELTAVLGRWPTYLNNWMSRSRGVDIEQSLTAFEEWWKKTFDPSGSFHDRADQDPAWQMNTSRIAH